MSVSFYNPGDQAIYDSGLSFIPQSQFRLGNPRMLMPGGIADTDVAANVLRPPVPFIPRNTGGDGFRDDDDDEIDRSNNLGINSFSDLAGFVSTPGMIGGIVGGIPGAILGRTLGQAFNNFNNPYTDVFGRLNKKTIEAIQKDYDQSKEAKAARDAFAEVQKEAFQARHTDSSDGSTGGSTSDSNSPPGGGGYCFDPNTLVQMADGSEKKIKEIQLGDQTKGGEVTGVFQFKASDEIHDYKGVTVAGSHYVKEDGKFIMVQDSPISIKIDKIPVVYSLDTTGRRIFIKDIEFADYNGDGIAKGFLANAGVDLTGFDKEVLRQVENRLI